MNESDFYRKYADLPLSIRNVPIDYAGSGNMTLSDIHSELIKLDEYMAPMEIRKSKLLSIASVVFIRMKK